MFQLSIGPRRLEGAGIQLSEEEQDLLKCYLAQSTWGGSALLALQQLSLSMA